MDKILYREAQTEEWEAAMGLAWRTFLRFEAPEYAREGIDNFRDFVTDETLKKMFINGNYILFVAVEAEHVVGMLSLRNVSHISLLFVDEEYHMRGIGRGLIEYMIRYMKSRTAESIVTVNAAPYAEGFYHRIGFIDRGLKTVRDGIIYTPMELLI